MGYSRLRATRHHRRRGLGLVFRTVALLQLFQSARLASTQGVN